MWFIWSLCGLCCALEIQCWCVRYLGVFAIVFAKLLWYLRLKNQTYAEILEYSILHRFGFERGGCGDGVRGWRAWVCRRKRSGRLAISLNRFLWPRDFYYITYVVICVWRALFWRLVVAYLDLFWQWFITNEDIYSSYHSHWLNVWGLFSHICWQISNYLLVFGKLNKNLKYLYDWK